MDHAMLIASLIESEEVGDAALSMSLNISETYSTRAILILDEDYFLVNAFRRECS